MNEPRRLLDGEASDLARSLLDTARDDAPGDAFVQRTLVAVGAGAVVLSATAIAAGAGSAAGSAALETAPATGLGLMVAKWIGIGATAGLITLGTADGVKRFTAPPAATTPAAVTAAKVQHAVSLRPARPAPAVSSEPPAQVPATKAAAPAFAPAPSSLADLTPELSALDSARAAASAGDATRALGELDGYAKKFPDGRLAQEAAYLRMQALEQRGDGAGAHAVARELLLRWPESPHAAHAREIVARKDP